MTPQEINQHIHIPAEDRATPIKENEARFIYDFLRQHQLKDTLECGFAYARSGAHIMAATGSRHVAIDPFQERYGNWGLQNVEKFGLGDRLEFHQDFSHNVLPLLLREGRQFDFIFIDGDHKFDGVLVDFYYADLLLRPGGYILFHDTWMRSTSLVMAFVGTNRADYTTVPTPLRNLHLVRKTGQDARNGMFFREFYTFSKILTHSVIRWITTGPESGLKRAVLHLKERVK